MKAINKKGREFKKDVMRFERAQKAKDKADKALEAFAASPIQYPTGTRPFKPSLSFSELDNTCNLCASEDFVISITLRAGLKRRECMQLIHHTLQHQFKIIEQEANV